MKRKGSSQARQAAFVPNCIMQRRQITPVAGSAAEQSGQRPRRRRQQRQGHRRPRRRGQRQDPVRRLEQQVEALLHSIAALEHQNLHLFRSRGTPDGAPASLVATFYRVFEHGLLPSQRATQDQFLRSMMASDVQGADYRGVEAMSERWALCSTHYVWKRVVQRRTEVVTLDESTIVVVDVAIRKRLNRSGIECLCPSIGGDEFTAQQLLTTTLEIYGSVRFHFDASGQVTWLSTDMDVVAALLRVLGSLSRVNACLQRSGMAQMTALMSADPRSEQRRPPSRDSRHDVAFLLS